MQFTVTDHELLDQGSTTFRLLRIPGGGEKGRSQCERGYLDGDGALGVLALPATISMGWRGGRRFAGPGRNW